jgi:choline kinase
MKAIILAAGVGRRLSPYTEQSPKCLLPIGGKSLLERRIELLAEVGVKETVLVVGHLKEQLQQRFGEKFAGLPLRYLENPEYYRGSIRSLWSARRELQDGGLIMDADVLFPSVLLRRLIASPFPNALCLDEMFSDSGEEMKLFAQSDRVVAISRKIPALAYDRVGEGVGFLKCDPPSGARLSMILDQLVRDGFDGDYEEAIDRWLRNVFVGWVPVNGLPWTEIDFAEDLERARNEIYPKISTLRDSGVGGRDSHEGSRAPDPDPRSPK